MFALVCFALQGLLPLGEFTVDITVQKPISPYIYGTNFPEWEGLGRGFTLARLGGNRTTAYNWETNASNAGADWHHQNDGHMEESNEAGLTYRKFLEAAQKHGAGAILTIPTLGYVSADKNADGDVNKTPDYLNVRFHKSLPAKPGGKLAYPPDTTDKFVYQDEFVAWLEKIKSPATPLWYSLDNEPDLWAHTHERIQPKPLTYAEIIANNIAYAKAIKNVAPNTMIFGPANYGWQGFRRFQNASDANDRDFLDVYLAAMRDAEKAEGKRLIDVLDIHWYPEARGEGIRVSWASEGDKPGTQLARMQASRSLWDPTYVEDSWIAENLGHKPIVLLPTIMKQIETHYPGTKLGITEYNYGGGQNASGLVAQADVLGLFGRYGLFAACHWGLSPQEIAQLAAFRAYINYDGNGARFGDLGLKVSGEDAAQNALFAALDSKDDKRLTLVGINKTAEPMPFSVKIPGFAAAAVIGYLVTDADRFKARPTEVTRSGETVAWTAPAHSVITVELRR
ncbi:MAG: glycoside hydrolase family 44 protein [Fimbriimonadaceae bacterium]